jgi:hypothetical protein
MSFWTWIAVAAFSWIGLSLLVAMIVAPVLGTISRESSNLLAAEADAWVFAPPMHASEGRSTAQVVGSRADRVRSRNHERLAV